MEVCQQTGLDWDEADKLVERVEADQGSRIIRSQLWILLAISTSMVFAGLWLTTISLIPIFQRMWSGNVHRDPVINYLLRLLLFSHWTYSWFVGLFGAIFGVALIMAGCLGAWKTLKRIS